MAIVHAVEVLVARDAAKVDARNETHVHLVFPRVLQSQFVLLSLVDFLMYLYKIPAAWYKNYISNSDELDGGLQVGQVPCNVVLSAENDTA
jgi:hypothetical protein